MKYCKECKQWKEEQDFSKDITAKDGLRYRCKQCDADYRNYLKTQSTIQNKQKTENKPEVIKLPKNYKICNCCKQAKSFEEFYRNKNHADGRADICKVCQEARRRGEIEAYTPIWKIRNELGQKQCTKCKQWKDETEFSKNIYSPDGLNTVCKLCDKTRAAIFRKPRELYSYEMYNEQGQKQCSKCKQWRSVDSFCKCTANKDGLSNCCKQCQHEYDIKRRGNYTPNYLQHNDGKKFCLTCKTWIAESDFYKSKQSKDGLSSRCKFCQQNYDREHREQIAERQKQYRLEKIKNPAFRLNEAFSSGIRQALKDNKAGRHWESLVLYNLEQLRKHLENQFTSKMNWNNFGSYWEIDHIIPQNLFSFNTEKDKDFQICWSLINLRPLERIENRQRPKDGSDISEEVKQSILGQNI